MDIIHIHMHIQQRLFREHETVKPVKDLFGEPKPLRWLHSLTVCLRKHESHPKTPSVAHFAVYLWALR